MATNGKHVGLSWELRGKGSLLELQAEKQKTKSQNQGSYGALNTRQHYACQSEKLALALSEVTWGSPGVAVGDNFKPPSSMCSLVLVPQTQQVGGYRLKGVQ